MALYLCLNEDGTGVVSEQNPIVTKHTSNGEPVTVPVYLVNDGKRKGVPNDQNPPPLIYTNLQIKIEGVGHSLESALTPSMSDVTLSFDNADGWNIGTIIKSGLERMRIEEVLSQSSVRVQRNYTADGKSSTIQSHQIGAMFLSENDNISLALPKADNYETEGSFLGGGVALSNGIDPTLLVNSVDSLETTNVIRTTHGGRYHIGSLIKIDQEVMKILEISSNDLTVLRGFNGTKRTSHSKNAVITCVGIVDIGYTHKFFIKNDPPSGLPTQKKKDIVLCVVADEEPQ